MMGIMPLRKTRPDDLDRRVIRIGDEDMDVSVERARRRRRSVAFVLESPTRLKVEAPERMSFSVIEGIMRRNERWLGRQVALLRAAPPLYVSAERRYVDGETIPYLGFALKLRVTSDAARRQGCGLSPRLLTVNLQDGEDYQDPRAREEAVRLEALLWLKRRAREKLRRRLDIWARRMGVAVAGLSVGGAERRWGSCGPENHIRLNWRLIMAPLPLMDYVVVHELAHVVHKDHSKRFWALVARYVPDFKRRREKLRAIGDRLVL